jgi:hypothetical protein
MKLHRAKRLYSVVATLAASAALLPMPGCGDDSSAKGGAGGEGGIADAGGEPGTAGAQVQAGAGGSQQGGATGEAGSPEAGSGNTGDIGSAGSAGTGGSTYTPAGDDVQAFLSKLAAWEQPPDASETTTDLPVENRSLVVNGATQAFKCARVQHDIVANHDEVLNFDIGSQYVLPGIILQGEPFQAGELAPIPFSPGKRAPIKLYVNVAGTDSASEVANPPTTAGLTTALAILQQRAELAAGENFAAKVSYSHNEVQSMEQLKWSLGLDFNYDGAFTDVGFQAAFANQEKVDKHTVVMKLQQDMYTVSFAYDELMRAADFFTDQLTSKDLQQLERDGYLSAVNQPVFVSSVTYGRMVVFTATSTRSESASSISQALQLSYDSMVGGSGSFNEEAAAEAQATLSNLEIKVLALGGNSDSISTAIQAGHWTELFSKPDILSAVPLRYVTRSMSKNRPIARLGDTTQFTTSECTLVPKTQGWVAVNATEFTAFKDVTTNQLDQAWALGDSNGVRGVYKFNPALEPPAFVRQGASNLVDIALDPNGNVWGVTSDGKLAVMTPGDVAFRPYMGGALATAVEAGQGGTLYMSDTYGNGGQRDLYLIPNDPSKPAKYWLDDAQCIPGSRFSFGLSSGKGFYLNGWEGRSVIFCGSESCGRCYGDLGGAVGSALTQVSTASDTDFWAIDRDGNIAQYVAGKNSFDPAPAALAPPESPRQLEAGLNLHHWIVTNSDRIYRYVPPG